MPVSVLEEMLVGPILPFILIKTNLGEPCVDDIGVFSLLSESSEDERLLAVWASELEDSRGLMGMCMVKQNDVSSRSSHRET